MYDTSARVARVKVRVRQLRRRREKRAIGALSALCLLLAASLVRALSAVTGGAPAMEQGMYGTMLLYDGAGGYVLVGVVSFTVAVIVTALCMKYRNREKRQDLEEENGKSENDFSRRLCACA